MGAGARQQIGGLQDVILVVSNCDLYGLTRNAVDVSAWLRELGLERYEQAFQKGEIDPAILPELTDADLKELGIPLGPRKQLLKAISALVAGTELPSAREARRPEAGRRQLTVMFADLVGSTELAARLDPEDMGQVIRAYHGACTDVVERWGGHVAKYMGDGVLAYFGWPQAHEDEAERAVRAGLEVADGIAKLNTPAGKALAARIGIATGMVVVGELIGAGTAQEEAVVGETPNLAARLQALAAPGSVVISQATRRLVGGLFELADLGPRRLKGFAVPLAAWQVEGEGRAEGRFEALHGEHLTPLVGREHELGILLERWAWAKEGEGQVVLLSGEPGIGKSRLIRALRERLGDEPYTSLSHYCSPYHTNSVLYPVIGLLERAAGFERDDAPAVKLNKLEGLLTRGTEHVNEAVPLIADLLGVPTGRRYPPSALSPQLRAQRTLEVLVEQVEGLAATKPVLVVYEDVHWMDPTTLQGVDLLIERVHRLPVLVLLTLRPEFGPPWSGYSHITQLSLARLTRRHGAELVAHAAGGKPLPEPILEEIVAKTDGVPLFAEELTRAVVESGLLEDAGDRFELAGALTSLAIPATLHDSLMARLDRLAPVREVAQFASVIGREFSHGLLAAIAGMGEEQLHQALDELVAAQLVFRRGSPATIGYSFKHALVQEAAYQSLLRSKRQQLHLKIAIAIEEKFPDITENQPEVLAHHYTEANRTKDAIDYWIKAGYRARTRFANVEAVSHLNKSLRMLMAQPQSFERDQRELEIQTALGVPLIATKGYAAAETGEAHLRALALSERVGDTSKLFPTLYGLWIFHLQRAELDKARKMADEYLQQATNEGDRTAVLIGHRILAVALFCMNELGLAHSHLTETVSIYDSSKHSSLAYTYAQDPYAAAQSLLAAIFWTLGYPDQACQAMTEAIACGERVQHPQSLVYALFYGSWPYIFSDPRIAVTHADRCLAISEEQRMPFFAGMSKVLRGWALALLGRADRGIEEILEGTNKARATGDVLHRSMQLTALAAAYQQANRLEEGLHAAEEALRATQEGAIVWFAPEISRLKGELLREQSRSGNAEAEACFHEAMSLARSNDARSWELRAATSLAQLWAVEGRRSEARDLLAPVYGWFTEGFDTADLKDAKALLDELA